MIHVVVPSFDCYDALCKCLASLVAQEGEFTATIIDDASPDDRQAKLVGAVCEANGWISVLNESNQGATGNIYWAITHANLEPNDVVFLLDGDDWLPHSRVLSRIQEIYEDPEIWTTYGSYESEPHDESCPPAEQYDAEVIASAAYRCVPPTFNHPLTFRAFLFHAIPESDLQLRPGVWIPEVYDEAIMYPVLEMAGDHARFLDEVLYTYNSANPLSVTTTKYDVAIEAAEHLRRMRPAPRMLMNEDGLSLSASDRFTEIISFVIRYKLTCVVETGSGYGQNAEKLAQFGEEIGRIVLTIEADQERHLATAKRLLWRGNAHAVFGHSPDVIRELSSEIPPAVWWLDAHVDDREGVDPAIITPVMDELFQILSRRLPDVILIDDARLFGTAEGYPSIEDVHAHVSRLDESFGTAHDVSVSFDIIRITPREDT